MYFVNYHTDIKQIKQRNKQKKDQDQEKIGIGRAKPLRRDLYFGCTHFVLYKTKTIRSINFQLNRYSNEKVRVNLKYYRGHQPTCNILMFIYIFFNWYSLHARLSSHYEAWSYKKKKHKKVKTYRKSIQKEPTVNRCLLILDLKPLRS